MEKEGQKHRRTEEKVQSLLLSHGRLARSMVRSALGLSLGNTGHDAVFNAALIRTAQNLEETIVTPVGVPRVSHPPVRSVVLLTPTENLDGVTTEFLARDVLVHTGLVAQEVLVHGVRSLNGTVGEDLILDGILIGGHSVAGGSEVLVSDPVGGVGASGSALRSGTLRAARRTRTSGVVLASSDLVRKATFVAVIVTTSHDTRGLVVVPSRIRVSTVATHTAGEAAARQDILSGEVSLVGAVGVDANTIGHGLSSAESPAGAASALVADVLGGRAFRTPLLTSIEAVRQVDVANDSLERQLLAALKSTAEVTSVADRSLFETRVERSGPGGLDAVDQVNELGALSGSGLGEGRSLQRLTDVDGQGEASDCLSAGASDIRQHIELTGRDDTGESDGLVEGESTRFDRARTRNGAADIKSLVEERDTEERDDDVR
jgi:hypothetical protein